MNAHPGGMPVPPQQAQEPARLAVTPVPGSLLDDLLGQEDAAEAAAREAADRLRSLRDRIKAELTQAHPGVAKFDIAGTPHRPAKSMTWVDTVRLDTRAMKEREPETYVRYAVFGGRWELRTARGGL